MLKEIEIGEPGVAPEAARISFEDVLRYGEVIAKVIATMHSLDTMAAGNSTKLDTVKLRVRGTEVEWDMGSVKRLK